jgi:glucosylglycerol 3-phosphatase
MPMQRLSLHDLLDELASEQDLLLVQDLDGVCMPLVRDPLTRTLPLGTIHAVAQLGHSLRVLTNGEHGGKRGVNRLVEQTVPKGVDPAAEGLYLPGLGAGGVQLQTRHGELSHPGVSERELQFLQSVPQRLREALVPLLEQFLPQSDQALRAQLLDRIVLDNAVSPTLNINLLIEQMQGETHRIRRLQEQCLNLLLSLLDQANQEELADRFFVHLAPNLGQEGERERLRPAAADQPGTTDFQFMLQGAVKEAGLLVLVNEHIRRRTGQAPLGDHFNVRSAPRELDALTALCVERIPEPLMPLLVGVGDTITSEPAEDEAGWQRGGSDRGFLTLVQKLGQAYGHSNRVVLVDSSGGELKRPSHNDPQLRGLTDPDDPLQLDVLVPGGPSAYCSWLEQLSQKRGC